MMITLEHVVGRTASSAAVDMDDSVSLQSSPKLIGVGDSLFTPFQLKHTDRGHHVIGFSLSQSFQDVIEQMPLWLCCYKKDTTGKKYSVWPVGLAVTLNDSEELTSTVSSNPLTSVHSYALPGTSLRVSSVACTDDTELAVELPSDPNRSRCRNRNLHQSTGSEQHTEQCACKIS